MQLCTLLFKPFDGTFENTNQWCHDDDDDDDDGNEEYDDDDDEQIEGL